MNEPINESVTEVFVEQPLASPGSANYIHCPTIGQLDIYCPTIGQFDIHCQTIGHMDIHCSSIWQLDIHCYIIKRLHLHYPTIWQLDIHCPIIQTYKGKYVWIKFRSIYEALQDIAYIRLPPGINFGISLKRSEIPQMGCFWSSLDS